MSDYQKLKARAQALQQEREEDLKRELAQKAEKDKQHALGEEEKRKRREAQAKEARRLELMRANDELVRQEAGAAGQGNGRIEYDPFAEDERRPAAGKEASIKAATGAAKPKLNPSNAPPRAAPRAGPSRPSPSTPKDRASPPPLGRKEKAARLFAQSAKKGSAADSIYSVRALVEGRSATSSPAPSPSTYPRQRNELPPTSSKLGGSVKDRLKKQASVDGLRKLCPDRMTRDRRTIDQIHKDIKARKGGGEAPAKRSRSASPAKRARSLSPVKGRVRPRPLPIPSTARPAPTMSSLNGGGPRKPSSPKRRRASLSPSTSSSTTAPPRGKRPRSRSPTFNSSQAAISAEIQALFRRPGRPEPRRYANSDDGSSDMEARMSDVEEEERRTARIARLEDERAVREERERKVAKERVKRERVKGKP